MPDNPLDNFLNSITQPVGNALGNEITTALFGRTDRISNKDFQFYQDLADSGNPREIARQNEFLEGVTPTNAAQYNVYQDATRPQETQRNIDSIKSMGTQLGMSPWELTGAGGASPLPSPSLGPQQGTGQASNFMAQLTPLAVTKMNNENALQIAAMNNQTAKEINTQTTGTTVATNTASNQNAAAIAKANNETATAIAKYAQTGPKAVQETALAAANTILAKTREAHTQAQIGQTQAATRNTEAQTNFLGQQTKESDARIANLSAQNENIALTNQVMQSEDLRKSITTLASLIPKETWTTPGYERNGLAQTGPLIDLAKVLAEATATQKFQRGDDYMRNLTPHDLDALAKAALAAAGSVKSAMDVVGKGAATALTRAKTLSPSEY